MQAQAQQCKKKKNWPRTGGSLIAHVGRKIAIAFFFLVTQNSIATEGTLIVFRLTFPAVTKLLQHNLIWISSNVFTIFCLYPLELICFLGNVFHFALYMGGIRPRWGMRARKVQKASYDCFWIRKIQCFEYIFNSVAIDAFLANSPHNRYPRWTICRTGTQVSAYSRRSCLQLTYSILPTPSISRSSPHSWRRNTLSQGYFHLPSIFKI